MTDTPVADWSAAFDRYRTANAALLANIDDVTDAAKFPQEVDPVLGEAHQRAGMALLYVPARHVVQVAQKIRVADNLFWLSQVHPDLVQILVDDLLSLVGLDAGDVPPLPAKVR